VVAIFFKKKKVIIWQVIIKIEVVLCEDDWGVLAFDFGSLSSVNNSDDSFADTCVRFSGIAIFDETESDKERLTEEFQNFK